ncbi:class I SAM-dependent methyltransferase [Phycisphaera mikurensis]|uniref:Putative methyltransferase n=1 Tax=Phycisphaera mikurensis (strain NBRC 102666 / KCTC 22515 / FYK2301M01) TaxID=1142394 RepID=I0IF19_PHYMF|nr:class I SAM-dependent methyltransferase [Phycisphaera mikurensis]MBB6441648.1 SAM-dependent methyltransferase [Phycisphaera mikurensis]BAM03857.1 putative methyltransferase [Phycisphaera mikurensis NBRC 102666]
MTTPRLYADLAHLWPALSPPEDYAAEAAELERLLAERLGHDHLKLVEFGAGGGCTLAHLSAGGTRGGRHDVTAVDLSPEMLAVAASHAPGPPGLRTVAADMRTVRLPDAGTFDAVLAHDAADYLLTEADLLATARSAAALLRSGGVALFAPTHTAETFEPGEAGDKTDDGTAYTTRVNRTADRRVRMTISLTVRGAGGTRSIDDAHELGLFPAATWLHALRSAGLHAEPVESDGPWSMFVGQKPS